METIIAANGGHASYMSSGSVSKGGWFSWDNFKLFQMKNFLAIGKLMINFMFVNCPRVKNKLFNFTIDNIFFTWALVKVNLQIYRQGCEIWSWSQILSKRTRQGRLFDNNGYGQHLLTQYEMWNSKNYFRQTIIEFNHVTFLVVWTCPKKFLASPGCINQFFFNFSSKLIFWKSCHDFLNQAS